MAEIDRGALPVRAVRYGVSSRALVRVGMAAASALLLANCANQPAGRASSEKSREIGAFSHAKYGTASPRVVADGQSVPKGGGRYHVGNPYRVAGRTYVPSDRPVGHSQTGLASWYGVAFHGRKTANGEVYDRNSVSAAHPTMPLPSYARVTNASNGRSIIVRVNDRGPFHAGRVMDVSERVAWALDFKGQGTARVKVDYLGKAGLGGSDDVRLLASLRQDGQPAVAPSIPASATMVASATPPPAPVAPLLSFRQDNASPTFSRPARQTAARDVETTAATPAGQLVRDVPAPAARPFDLGTIPGAAEPVRSTGSQRPRIASLSYAPEAGTLSKFQQGNPLAGLSDKGFQQKPRTLAQR